MRLLLDVYGSGALFCLGVVLGRGGRAREAMGAVLWPLTLPVGLAARFWTRRQVRRWNALSMDQRKALNDAGKGVLAKRWPYRYTPWVTSCSAVRGDGQEWSVAHMDEMTWWLCPNEPRCPHGALFHDVYDFDDPSPTCCVDGCTCGT